MPLLKLPNVSVPVGGDVYSISLNQGYTEAPSTIDVSVINAGGVSLSLSGNPVSISIGDLSFKGYCYSVQTEEKVGEKVTHLKYCDGSIILDQIQVGLVQRHYGLPKEAATPKKISGTFSCPQCDGSVIKIRSQVEAKVRRANFIINNVFIMGEEEPTHSQCDFPDVNYTFGDLIGLMKQKMSVTFMTGVEPNSSSYRNKFVGSLREVLSNWCAEYGYSFYWDFVANKLVIYSLVQGIQIGRIFETIKNSPGVYVKAIKEGQDLSSTHSHGVSVMKQMPSQTYSSVPYRNFVGIYYNALRLSCGGNLYAGMIAKMFGTEARKAYLISQGNFARVGFSGLKRVFFENNPAIRINNPCHEQTGIPTLCNAINGQQAWVGTYSESTASYYEELDLCEANNYGAVAQGPFIQPGNIAIWGDVNAALNGQTSPGTCSKNGATTFTKETIENRVNPSWSYIETRGGSIKGISLPQAYGVGSWSSGGQDIFAYKIEGQSQRWMSAELKGKTIFVFPNSYLQYQASITERAGPGDGSIGTIETDIDGGGQTPSNDCGCVGANTSEICPSLKNCDPVRWRRQIGWFMGNARHIAINGVKSPTVGSYVGYIEQSKTTDSTVDPTENYRLQAPPDNGSVMNTSLTLVDANGDNSTELPNVPPPHSDTQGRIEKSLEIVGVLDRSLQGELTPSNGVESFQINFGSEGITTIINFANKGRKFPNPNIILSPTISARGNYVTPTLGIASQ